MDEGSILLVDDEEAIRRAIGRKLRKEGHVILEASTGREALGVMERNSVDVVVSDITMPDMDGMELLRQVRLRQPDVPFILMTGVPEMATAMKAVEYGAFEYVTKPFDLAKLAASITRALEKHRAAVAQRQILDSAVRSRNSSGSRSIGDRAITKGTVLAGKYSIVRSLGSGGMGTVYEAERQDLGRMPVAVKVLHDRLADRTDLLQRFRREAEVVASINHPNIVRILDFVATETEPTLIVMELLEGSTLAAAIANDPPFPERRVAFIASQILAALAAAHEMSVVHRDLKPENVFLTTIANIGDVVKLLDFGIAKLLADKAEPKLTQTGTVLGTPAYMAPEYARGEAADALGDVYAVGCVMYEMLVRKQPFVAANYNALLFAIQDTEPEPISNTRADVSTELVAIIAKAMSKERTDRFANARKMMLALEPWLPQDEAPTSKHALVGRFSSAPTEEQRAIETREGPAPRKRR